MSFSRCPGLAPPADKSAFGGSQNIIFLELEHDLERLVSAAVLGDLPQQVIHLPVRMLRQMHIHRDLLRRGMVCQSISCTEKAARGPSRTIVPLQFVSTAHGGQETPRRRSHTAQVRGLGVVQTLFELERLG